MHTALDYIKFIAFYSFLPLFRMSCQLQNFINGFLVFYKKRDVHCKWHDTKRYHTVNYSWTVYSRVHGVKWFMLYCFHTQVICFEIQLSLLKSYLHRMAKHLPITFWCFRSRSRSPRRRRSRSRSKSRSPRWVDLKLSEGPQRFIDLYHFSNHLDLAPVV